MNSVEAFLRMGGYAVYVWSSYGIAAVVLAVNLITSRRAERNAMRRAAARHGGPLVGHDS